MKASRWFIILLLPFLAVIAAYLLLPFYLQTTLNFGLARFGGTGGDPKIVELNFQYPTWRNWKISSLVLASPSIGELALQNIEMRYDLGLENQLELDVSHVTVLLGKNANNAELPQYADDSDTRLSEWMPANYLPQLPDIKLSIESLMVVRDGIPRPIQNNSDTRLIEIFDTDIRLQSGQLQLATIATSELYPGKNTFAINLEMSQRLHTD